MPPNRKRRPGTDRFARSDRQAVDITLEPQPGTTAKAPPNEPPTAPLKTGGRAAEQVQAALASPENAIATANTERFCDVLKFVFTEEFFIIE